MKNLRNLTGLGFGIAALGITSSAFAQTAPFTIRRPLDGATVREKVRVEIPRTSIKAGSFVAFFIDDKFVVAQAPEGDNKPKPMGGVRPLGGATMAPPPRKEADLSKQPFYYIWDTKATKTSDGEHKLKAVLFDPAPGTTGMVEGGSTEVKVTVANKINDGPTSLLLRYKYREGESLEYSRTSSAKLKGGEQQGASGTGDTELGAVRSKIVLGIEDSRPNEDLSLVRNKLTSLRILTNGQEVTATADQLSESMYQEIDSRGKVSYETGALTGFAEYANSGIPVDNTVGLPILPEAPIAIGDSWILAKQRLDIPGVPVALQPQVAINSKLDGLEWEAGRPAAKIRQTYTGELPEPVRVGGMLVTTPTIEFERVIYFAYKSGIILRTTRTLTIKGRTADAPMSAPTATAGGAGGGNMMAAMMGRGGPGGMPAGMMGGGGGGMPSGIPAGMMGAMRGGGMPGGMPGGMMGGPGGGSGMPSGIPAGMMRGGGGRGAQRGGTGRTPGGRGTRGGGGSGMMGGPGGMMGGPGGMMGGPGGMMGSGGTRQSGRRATNSLANVTRGAAGGFAQQQDPDRAVTIEATQDTEVQKISANR